MVSQLHPVLFLCYLTFNFLDGKASAGAIWDALSTFV
jgi:hypothetical protein